MNICRRTFTYISRKKGQTLVLFLLFCIVSTFLILCFAIWTASDNVATDLRSSIGGAFYLRPSKQLAIEDGAMKEDQGPPATIADDVIDEIMQKGHIKYFNALNYGYARSEKMNFIPGSGYNAESNMGKVAAMQHTALADLFIEGKLTLAAGRHIKEDDQNKILISEALAAANQWKVGDKIPFTHANLERDKDGYTDSIVEKSAFCEAEVVGIYKEVGTMPSDSDVPTPGRNENLIFSDHAFLINLAQAQAGNYSGEINFYVSDPLKLADITNEVEKMDEINWKRYSLRENDFQYAKIADSLSSMQQLAQLLISCVSLVSMLILILILTMRARGRIHEAGILLAIGKGKQEIVWQFLLEILIIYLIAFLCAMAIAHVLAGSLESMLFGELVKPAVDLKAIETGIPSTMDVKTYLHFNSMITMSLFLAQGAAMGIAAALSWINILSLKPNEILTRMS